jgi:hypothetical protein
MLLFTQAGTGAMLDTQASAGSLNFTAYSVGRSDGSISVVLVNKDATNAVQASVDMGAPVGGASATYLQAPSLTATSGVTLAGAGVSPTGNWSSSPPFAPASSGNVVSVLVPAASAALVRVYNLNGSYGNQTRVFEQGDSNAAFPTEWDFGNYKGDCGAQAAITGLSSDPNNSFAHGLLCWSASTGEFAGSGVATVSPVSSGDHRRYSRNGDWDPDYYKSECGLNEYVSGVSQAPGSGAIHGIRCASANMTASGTSNCETHLVTRDDGVTFEWDFGYHKGQCNPGQVVVGVSAETAAGLPHAILCCDG